MGRVFMYTLPETKPASWRKLMELEDLVFLESTYWRLKRQRSVYDTNQTMHYLYMCIV